MVRILPVALIALLGAASVLAQPDIQAPQCLEVPNAMFVSHVVLEVTSENAPLGGSASSVCCDRCNANPQCGGFYYSDITGQPRGVCVLVETDGSTNPGGNIFFTNYRLFLATRRIPSPSPAVPSPSPAVPSPSPAVPSPSPAIPSPSPLNPSPSPAVPSPSPEPESLYVVASLTLYDGTQFTREAINLWYTWDPTSPGICADIRNLATVNFSNKTSSFIMALTCINLGIDGDTTTCGELVNGVSVHLFNGVDLTNTNLQTYYSSNGQSYCDNQEGVCLGYQVALSSMFNNKVQSVALCVGNALPRLSSSSTAMKKMAAANTRKTTLQPIDKLPQSVRDAAAKAQKQQKNVRKVRMPTPPKARPTKTAPPKSG